MVLLSRQTPFVLRLNRSFALDEEKKEVGSELTVEGYPFYPEILFYIGKSAS
jgi:hypothetical protein